ncbi:MAG: hypothetical protein LBQ35_06145 [Spirochaetaceae bacterium]|nr:hypothetical protein [Spirochaetaceae bacterium]
MSLKHIPSLALLLCSLAAPLPALDLWRNPEAAGPNALFLDGAFASLSFQNGFATGKGSLEFRLDYLVPLFLPLSLGFYFRAPNPNLTSFGLRAAYHIDLRDDVTDLFFLYVFDLGFLRNDTLAAYGDEKQPLRFYDFRAGVRRRFGRFFCLSLETDFQLAGVVVALSVKLN